MFCVLVFSDNSSLVKYKRGTDFADSFQNLLSRHHANSEAEDEISLLLREILDLAHARTDFAVVPVNADTILKFRTT